MKAIILYLVGFLTAELAALGSEEEVAPWQSASVSSQELPEAGVVSIDALQDKNGRYQKFTIQAFGAPYSLSADELRRLDAFPLASVTLRHEAGYPQLGGYTVHIRLERSSYDQTARKTVRELLYISIPKKGKLILKTTRN